MQFYSKCLLKCYFVLIQLAEMLGQTSTQLSRLASDYTLTRSSTSPAATMPKPAIINGMKTSPATVYHFSSWRLQGVEKSSVTERCTDFSMQKEHFVFRCRLAWSVPSAAASLRQVRRSSPQSDGHRRSSLSCYGIRFSAISPLVVWIRHDNRCPSCRTHFQTNTVFVCCDSIESIVICRLEKIRYLFHPQLSTVRASLMLS